MFVPRQQQHGPSTRDQRRGSALVVTALQTAASAMARTTKPVSWRESAQQVTWPLLLVLRNAGISVAFAWVVMLCFSTGNVVRGRAPRQQSSLEFAASILLWWKLFNWVCVAASFAAPLLSQRFVSKPSVAPSFLVCWFKVLRGTHRLTAATTAVAAAIGIGLLHVPASVRTLRLHFYANAFWYHVDTVACNIEATRIFESETVRGQEKQRTSAQSRPVPYWKRVVRVYALSFTSMCSFFVAALYAHVTSNVVLDSPTELVTFTLVSFGLKIALQEIAKYCVFKQKVQSVTTMAGIVGIPTILIDTQMRIVLLCAQSISATLSGTLGMTIAEVTLRCTKSMFIKYSIRQVYVDMFAEYVALGCSYVILFFCWNHPKYMLRRFHDSSPSTTSSPVDATSTNTTTKSDDSAASESLSAILGASQAIIMACQLGAEIVVDFASCLLEVGNGIDFRPLQRQSFFLAVLLMWAATGNISISANMFVQVGD